MSSMLIQNITATIGNIPIMYRISKYGDILEHIIINPIVGISNTKFIASFFFLHLIIAIIEIKTNKTNPNIKFKLYASHTK